MANSWFRLWTDMINDPKWRTIARVSKQKVGDVIAVYVHMMTMAANASERGRTEGFNDEDVATALDIETEQVAAIREAMQGRVLDGDRLTGWEKRQPLREDGAAERGKAFRERKKAQTARAQTQPNATERQIREEEIREEDKTTTTDASAPAAVDGGGGGDQPDGPDFDAPPAAPLPPANPALALTLVLRPLGVTATSTNPIVMDWASRGVSTALLAEAVAIARESKGNESLSPQYLEKIVERLLNPRERRAAPRAADQSQKFHFAGADRTGDQEAMAASMARNGITPETLAAQGDIEI